MDGKHSNAFLSGGGIGDWIRKFGQILKRASKIAQKGEKFYDAGEDLFGMAGKKKESAKSKKGGAELLYNRDIRPRQRMDLFYE